MLDIIKKEKKSNAVFVTILFLLFLYIVYRAWHLSLTHDEGLSYQIILGDAKLASTANNHFLNTFLMALCYKCFGHSELSLRLPNIAAFILYAFACFQLLKTRPLFVTLTGISFLLFNPYILDFFSLARGYGLALGFFMASFLYLLRAVESTTMNAFLKNASLTMILSLGACFSNLTYINAHLAIFLLLFLSFLFLRKDPEKNINAIIITAFIIIINIVSLIFLLKQLVDLKNAGELYHGGSNGFISDTLNSIIWATFYSNGNNYGHDLKPALNISFIVLFAATLIYTLIFRRHKRLLITVIFLGLMVIAPVLQHLIFATPLPMDRTALIYIPLFGLCISFFMEDLILTNQRISLHLFINVFSLLLFVLPLCYNLIINVNFDYTLEWYYDKYTKDGMKLIKELTATPEQKKQPVSISYSWMLEPSIKYYKTYYSLDNLILAGPVKKNINEDFVYLWNRENNEAENLEQQYFSVKKYDENNFLVYRRNENSIVKHELFRHNVFFKASNKKYLGCGDGHNILAEQDRGSSWETFVIIIYDNNECVIQNFEGYFLSPELDHQKEVTATRSKIGPWEIFHIVKLKNGQVAFKAVNGKHLSLDEKTLQIYAKADSIGTNEKFDLYF
jgi:hypothetical protein